jgi:hypothetical protein
MPLSRIYKKYLSIFLIVILLLTTACTRMSQKEAEAKALQFVKERVKFYAKENNSELQFPSYDYSALKSYSQGNSWIIVTHVSATIQNTTKKSDIVVEIDSRNGRVIKFNNQPVNNQ